MSTSYLYQCTIYKKHYKRLHESKYHSVVIVTPSPLLSHFWGKVSPVFVPNYQEVQVLAKYFNTVFFHLYAKLSLNFFPPSFQPVYRPQNIKIYIDAFPQNYRHVKYISFATLLT